MRTAGKSHRTGGFTLVEMLVVITVIAILASMLVIFIRGSIRRSRESATKGTIEMLTAACESYRQDFNVYPKQTLGGSKALHQCLGGPRTMVVGHSKTGPQITKEAEPYIEFRLNLLAPGRSDPYPGASPSDIYDFWGRVIQYRDKGTYNKGSVDIWSYGDDGQDQASDPNSDDVTNWRH